MALRLRPAVHSGVGLEGIVQAVLDDVALCTMATVNEDGTAHINNAFFCVDRDWRMFFMSSREARHSRNLAARQSVAVAVCNSDQGWDDWKVGLQLFGRCAIAEGADAGLGVRLYKERFPAFAKWLDGVGRVVGGSDAPTLFMVVPESLKVLHEEVLGEETFVRVALLRG